MAYVDNTLGNLLIKYHDRWRGDYYLKEDLTFGVNRVDAARFYLLKAGDTAILNGDRVSVHVGNRTLVIDDKVKLVDRDTINPPSINSFILTNGTENTDPIVYDTPMFFISDKNNKMALKYEWGMELIVDPGSTSNYRPRSHPNLTNGSYNADISVNMFRFSLERADGPITNLEEARSITTTAVMTAGHPMTKSEFADGYRGAIMVVLLMIVLILCIFLNR